MIDYIVKWEVRITATNPEDAALRAFRLMQDRNTNATLFKVVHPDGSAVDVDTEDLPR